jgi:hypothetical protein
VRRKGLRAAREPSGGPGISPRSQTATLEDSWRANRKHQDDFFQLARTSPRRAPHESGPRPLPPPGLARNQRGSSIGARGESAGKVEGLTIFLGMKPVQFWLLAAYTALLGIETGAGLFTTAAVFPVWAGSAAGAIGWVTGTPYRPW